MERHGSEYHLLKAGQKTYGYIRSDLLTLVKKGDASAEPAGTTSTTNTNTTPSANSGNIQTDDILTVTATAVRVREDPSDSSKIITNLLQGDKVKFKKTKNRFRWKAVDESICHY